ncbi:MFS transporter [Endozoicomonas lisbonensis]|uniref:MFS family permease n=1 Tax=Endozoicomonas lisbonensis TaxID=3120522 RepID=A0ABV2SP42_9GAMM
MTTPVAAKNRIVVITSLGGFLEAYDFTVYAHMSAYLSLVFFPAASVGTSLLNTFITFSVGYLARPLGAIVFSHWGDRNGRKGSFMVTVVLMAVATFGIGILPGHEQIGVLAPVTLALFRLLQGFCFAGEFSGAVTYLYETIPTHRQGVGVACLGAGTMAGILMGVLMHSVLVTWFDERQLIAWGWRIPFLLGGSLGGVSYVIRRRFVESSVFTAVVERGQRERIPFMTLLTHYKAELLLGILVLMPVLASVCMLFFFTPGYLTRMLGYSAEAVAYANSLNMFLGLPVCIVVGWLGDRYNRYWIMTGAGLLVAIAAWPVFSWYAGGEANLLVAAVVGALMWGSVEGIAILLVVSSFPVALRYTGMACSYNICATLFAGMGTMVGFWLIRLTGNMASPGYYLVISGLAGAIGAYLLGQRQSVKPAVGRLSGQE